MMKYKLSELFELQMGKTPERRNNEFWQDGNKEWISIADLSKCGKYIEETKEYITDSAISATGIKTIPENTVIMSFKLSIGKVAITKKKMYSNEAIMAFIDRKKIEIDTNYLYYAFLHKNWDEGINKAVMGKTLNKSTLSQIEFYIHDYDEQVEIANVLDKFSKVIESRKKQLIKLDNLIKSRFVEMFGDPVINNKNWIEKKVIEVCDCMVPGRDKPKSFSGDIPWTTIDDLVLNGITYESKSGLGLQEKEILEVKRKTVPKGSVLMSCVGNLGVCSIAGKALVINQQLHSFQCRESINNYFLMHQLGWKKDYMNKNASSTTVLYMNKTICNSIPIILPPIDLQNQFATFVQQVDKLKFTLHHHLHDLKFFFKTLQSHLFYINRQ